MSDIDDENKVFNDIHEMLREDGVQDEWNHILKIERNNWIYKGAVMHYYHKHIEKICTEVLQKLCQPGINEENV